MGQVLGECLEKWEPNILFLNADDSILFSPLTLWKHKEMGSQNTSAWSDHTHEEENGLKLILK